MAYSHPDHAPIAHTGHVHLHAHDQHDHGAAAPHPAQAPPWSILRMTLWGRLTAALLLSAGLWAAVLLAMR